MALPHKTARRRNHGKATKTSRTHRADGWGFRAETKGNAIALARKPNYDELMKKFPNTLIQTSGPAVGLPEGQMGNSEVGHMNIGAGRIVHMDITRIDLLIANKQLDQVPLFQQAMERGRQRQLHFIGLLSDGGVHSHIQHLFALLELAKKEKVEKVFVHASRTVATRRRTAAATLFASSSRRCANSASDKSPRSLAVTTPWTATIAGSASNSPTTPSSTALPTPRATIPSRPCSKLRTRRHRRIREANRHYAWPWARRAPVGLIRDDDAVIFYNFRADRARQMTCALAAPDFDKFADPKRPKNLFYVAMTKYDKNWPWLKCRNHAGKTRAHSRAGISGTAVQESALRRNGKIRARHLFFQWRRRKAVRRRRTHPGALTESRYLRPDAGNVRCRNHRHAS